MIIHSRRSPVTTLVAPKQPEPQRPVENKPVVKEVKKDSTNKVQRILEEIEEEVSHTE